MDMCEFSQISSGFKATKLVPSMEKTVQKVRLLTSAEGNQKTEEQAGAELCQAQQNLSLALDTN